MNKLGRWVFDGFFVGFLGRVERDFGKGYAEFLSFMVALAIGCLGIKLVFWALTGEW